MTIHVYPTEDIIEHDTESLDCVCEPTIVWSDEEGQIYENGPLVIHNEVGV